MQNKITNTLIAPCGMNCGTCVGYLREKNKCLGCNNKLVSHKHCMNCSIRNCEELKNANAKFCFSCKKFPCARLKNLDKRYRTKYLMSMIENLGNIKSLGIRQFVKQENERWKCPNCQSIICVHKKACLNCGSLRAI